MNYPSGSEIMNRYLYSDSGVQNRDLIDPNLIRSGSVQNSIIIDAISYMDEGPGRFSNISRIPMVNQFFAFGSDIFPADGTRQEYSVAQLLNVFGPKTDRTEYQQYNFLDENGDYAERVFFWNSVSYTVGENTKFVLNPDGSRQLENVQLRPFDDNFDFNSDDLLADITGFPSQIATDPSEIGRLVKLIFDNDSKDQLPIISTYSIDDFNADLTRYANEFISIQNPVNFANLGFEVLNLYDELNASGITDFTQDGKAVVFGKSGGGELMLHSKLNSYNQAAALNEGIIFVGSNSADIPFVENLFVFGEDFDVTLYGFGGNDTLKGGRKDDELFGGDGQDDLDGGDGADELFGDAGSDTLHGGYSALNPSENDLIADRLEGGEGFDTYYGNSVLNETTIAHIDLGADRATPRASIREVVDTISDSDGNGRLIAGSTQDDLAGTYGLMFYGLGLGDQNLIGGIEPLWQIGLNGIDLLTLGRGGKYFATLMGPDLLLMEEEFDSAVGASVYYGLAIVEDFENGAFGLNLSGMELIHEGSDGDDDIDGGGEDDRMDGNDGNDNLDGEGGDDTIDGGRGNDTIDGGIGQDTIRFREALEAININLATGIASDGTGSTDTVTNVENVIGTQFNDTIVGNDADNIFYADQGADTYDGGQGSDTLDYSSGDSDSGLAVLNVDLLAETVTGTLDVAQGDSIANINNVIGSLGQNHIIGNDGANFIDLSLARGGSAVGNGGDDTIVIGKFIDFADVSGGDGVDTIVYKGDDSFIFDLAEHGFENAVVNVTRNKTSFVFGSDADNRIEGSEYKDVFSGGGGDDVLIGGDGQDRLAGGAGDDFIDGGGHEIRDTSDPLILRILRDTIEFEDHSRTLSVDMNIGTATYSDGEVDTFTNIEQISVKGGTNNLIGGNGSDGFVIEGGNDTIAAGDGDDIIYLNDIGGTDFYDGEAGNDLLYLSENRTRDENGERSFTVDMAAGTVHFFDVFVANLTGVESAFGSRGDDVFQGDAQDNTLDGFEGNDTLRGGAGNDVLNGDVGDDVLDGQGGRDTLNGSFGDDVLFGRGGRDVLLGGSGNDELVGGNGEDDLQGGFGDDVLKGGKLADRLDGGNDVDTVVYGNSEAAVTINLTAGTATGGHAEGDVIFNVENVTGSGFGDVLTGDTLSNKLNGKAGNDTLSGNGGRDKLLGGAGDDILLGGNGRDKLTGGADNDILTGGNGRDTFVFGLDSGSDIVTDFQFGPEVSDRVNVKAYGFADFAAVQSAMTENVEGTTLALGTGSVLFQNIALADFSMDYFLI